MVGILDILRLKFRLPANVAGTQHWNTDGNYRITMPSWLSTQAIVGLLNDVHQ